MVRARRMPVPTSPSSCLLRHTRFAGGAMALYKPATP